MVRKVHFILQTGCSHYWEYEVLTSLILKTFGKARLYKPLRESGIQVQVIKSVLRGNANWEPVS